MSKIPAKVLISLGLTIFLLGLLLLAVELKVVANPVALTLQSRARFCETAAIGSSLFAKNGDTATMDAFLDSIVERNDDVLSAAMRRSVGDRLLASTEYHSQAWERDREFEQETHVEVPVYDAEGEEWGTVEIAFEQISQKGIFGYLRNHAIRLLLFVGTLGFVVFYLYLDKMLKVMNSKSVPQRVRTALNTLAGGLIVADANGDIVLANDAVSAWVGIQPEHLLGTAVDSLPWLVPKGTPELPWDLTFAAQLPMSGGIVQMDSPGGRKALIANSSPMISDEGDLRGVFIGLEDVTILELKKIEHKKLREEAERANSAKSDFLARMSHEIRTPMNAILGFTDVLRRGFDQDAGEREDYLNTIHSSGEHLLSLINDILDLSKVEAGKMQMERVQYSPHKIILETLQVLLVKADEKDLDLSYEPTNGVPEFVQGDPVRLRQIVTNLVGNAIKFTENGSVRVTSRMVEDNFEFTIIDTGIGISAEALGRIFDPFSQADDSVTRKFGGTGLGLAISKKFAEAMGGRIRVESKEGVGTRFIVTINPGTLVGIRRIDSEEAMKAGRLRQNATVEAKLPPCNILIVDDGSSNRKLLRLFLGRAGASLVEAENGQEAIDRAKEQKFDVILMDMQMPVMDGYTAAAKLREMGFTIPIVALTAHAMKEDEAKCMNAGCSHFLPKPVDSNKLLTLMSEVLGGQTRKIERTEVAKQLSAEPKAKAPQAKPPQPKSQPVVPSSNVAASGDPAAKPTNGKIRSTLPLDDKDFRDIVIEFVTRLHEQIDEMSSAFRNKDFEELAKLAHWLKGSGGTAGFADLTEPAKQLEMSAKQQDASAIAPALQCVTQIARRLEMPKADAVAAT